MFPSWFCNTSLPSTKSFLANTLPKINSPCKAKLLQNLYHYSYYIFNYISILKRKVPKNWHFSQNPTGYFWGGSTFSHPTTTDTNNLQPKARWWCTWSSHGGGGGLGIVGVSSWWLNQPIWEKYATVKLDYYFPRLVSENQKYLSCHHLGFCCFKIGILLSLRGLYHVFVVVLSFFSGWLNLCARLPWLFLVFPFPGVYFQGSIFQVFEGLYDLFFVVFEG